MYEFFTLSTRSPKIRKSPHTPLARQRFMLDAGDSLAGYIDDSTVSVAIWIAWMCRSTKEVYINLAVLCWIIANSAWMLMEFFDLEDYKLYTALPFGLGLIFTLYFYLLIFREKSAS